MKKFFKILGLILLVIVVFVLIAGLFVPKDYHYEQSITINASREKVWQHVSTLQAQETWSPWIKADPNIKTSFEGTPGAVGSIYRWEGNSDVGKGVQTLAKSEPQSSVQSQIHFIKPWEGDASTGITLAGDGGSTTATWTFDSRSKYPMNVMSLFFDMDEMMGEHYTTGLNELKRLSESN